MSVTSATFALAPEDEEVVVPPPPDDVLPHAVSNIVNKIRNVVIGARPLILRILASFLFGFKKYRRFFEISGGVSEAPVGAGIFADTKSAVPEFEMRDDFKLFCLLMRPALLFNHEQK